MHLCQERALEPELLDGEIGSYELYLRTMQELESINRLTLGYRPTIAAVRDVVRRASLPSGRRLSVLDIGFGYGDTLRALGRWADATGVALSLEGIDLNPWACRAAEAATPAGADIRYRVGDIFSFEGGPYDVIINSLFMHHLSDEEIPRVLRWMSAHARLAWFINDLHRHSFAYHVIKRLTHSFSESPLIKNDAPLSVARAFTHGDWVRYLRLAGLPLERTRIRWHCSFRFGVFHELAL